MSYHSTLFLIFSARSSICTELIEMLRDHNINYSSICIDSKKVRGRCKLWGATVVPTIVDVSSGYAQFHEGLWSCQDLVYSMLQAERAPATPDSGLEPTPTARPGKKPHKYIIAKPEPFELIAPASKSHEPVRAHEPATPAKQEAPPGQLDPTETGHIDPDQDSLDLSISGNNVSSLAELLSEPAKPEETSGRPKATDREGEIADISKHDNIVDPHEKQRQKIKAFQDRRAKDAQKRQQQAKEVNDENVKEDLISKAKRMQQSRDVDDTDIHRSVKSMELTESLSRP